jgi:hypothetical protein
LCLRRLATATSAVKKADMPLQLGSALAANPLRALASRLLAGHAGRSRRRVPAYAGTTDALTEKRGGWPEVSVVSHSGKEKTIVVEIARYTAPRMRSLSLALKL